MQYRNPYYSAANPASSSPNNQYGGGNGGGGGGSDNGDSQNFANAREFIKEKLYFVSLTRAPAPQENVHFFTIDHKFVYTNFYADFGPSNISHVVRFCNYMQELMESKEMSNKVLCLYSSFEIDKRANAAFLLCAYMVLVIRKTPEEAYQSLMGITPAFMPYRDAGYGPATYHITILDCIRGLSKVMATGLFDINKFDVEEYEFYEKVENGDYNWITPKFLALASPKDDPPAGVPDRFQISNAVSKTSTGKSLYSCYKMTNLVKWMVENNIKTIIRLNNKTYEKNQFVEAGIEHIELYFPDGSTPPDMILKRFLEICESRSGPIAVHCKAGLGRTGSLIAAYLMKHYRLTACEVISYMRVIRPGSVVGPQQNYLQAMQPKLWKMTPSVRLPVQVSLWQGVPALVQATRFGTSKYAAKIQQVNNPPLPNDRYSSLAPTTSSNNNIYSAQGASNSSAFDYRNAVEIDLANMRSTYGDVQDYEKEIARERSGQTSTSVEQLSIPIQPRKHLQQSQPQTQPRTDIISNGAWRAPVSSILQQSYAQHPQQLQQQQYFNGSDNKYHLRSQSANVQQQARDIQATAAAQRLHHRPRLTADSMDNEEQHATDEMQLDQQRKNSYLDF